MKKESRYTLLDVYYAHQLRLERFFHRPGTCYGDLRRMQLMAAQMMESTMQMYQAMTHASITVSTSGESLILAYFDHANPLPELYSEGDEPHFCGGPLEKARLSECQERDKWHRTEENIRARNAKRRRDRSFRISPRTCGRCSV